MKRKNIIVLIAVVVLAITVFYSFQGSQDDTAYRKQIEKEREEKDRFMRTSAESPAPEKYKGLNYYPPDIKYRVIADLVPVTEMKPVMLTTNDGKTQRYIEYAYAEFKLDGVNNRLLILEIADIGPSHGKLFLAFGDETSAVETYGAGRYLDVAKNPGSQTITLDFNLAYNPYCAYDDSYTCPLPPRENILKIPIKAGEKNYH